MEKMYNKSTKVLLINETFIIDHKVHSEWIYWFTNNYLIAIKNSDLTKDIILSKMQDDNPDGKSYALQFKIKETNLAPYRDNNNLITLRSELNTKFHNKFGSFVTVLNIVQD